MSSTNKTTNYNLSQFVGGDKPAWLLDYNQDMSKIDTGIKGAADAAEVADGKADSNTNNIGNLANLNTQAKTNLVASINEVYTTSGTAEGTANAAATAANSAKDEADALSSYFSITQNGKINVAVTGGTISNIDEMYYALNTAGTLGKVYGRLRVNISTSGTCTVTLPVPVNTNEAFTISSAFWFSIFANGSITIINSRDVTVNTNGTITFELPTGQNGASATIWFPPCLYFFTDFGDVYNPQS